MVDPVAIGDKTPEKNPLAIFTSPPKGHRRAADLEPGAKKLKTGTLPELQPGTHTNVPVQDAAQLILQAVRNKKQKVAEAKDKALQTNLGDVGQQKPVPKKKAASKQTPEITKASPTAQKKMHDGCETPLKTKPELPTKLKDKFHGFISNERSRSQILARGYGNSAKGKSAAGALKNFKYTKYGGEEAALEEAKKWLVQNKFV